MAVVRLRRATARVGAVLIHEPDAIATLVSGGTSGRIRNGGSGVISVHCEDSGGCRCRARKEHRALAVQRIAIVEEVVDVVGQRIEVAAASAARSLHDIFRAGTNQPGPADPCHPKRPTPLLCEVFDKHKLLGGSSNTVADYPEIVAGGYRTRGLSTEDLQFRIAGVPLNPSVVYDFALATSCIPIQGTAALYQATLREAADAVPGRLQPRAIGAGDATKRRFCNWHVED